MATTKKAVEAAKTETAKVEAVKAEEAVAEKVTAADTKEEAVAAPAKETKTTAAKKTATKKTAAPKATKTTKAAKAPAKKEEAEVKEAASVEMFVEYNGVQVSYEEIVRLVKGSYGKEAKDLKIYVKPEDNRAYYVADGEAGSVRVLFL